MSIQKKLTIVTTTSLVPSCPSAALLRHAFESFYTQPHLLKIRHLISVDMTVRAHHMIMFKRPKEVLKRYVAELQDLARQYPNVEIVLAKESSILQNIIFLVRKVNTPYFLFWEHDWVFSEKIKIEGREYQPGDLAQLFIDVLDKHSFIKDIRYNYHTLYEKHQFIKAKRDARIAELPLMQINTFENTPHIARTKTWKNIWVPIFLSTQEKFSKKSWIEQPLTKESKQSIRDVGWDKSSEKWGFYRLGDFKEPRTISHLDGKYLSKEEIENNRSLSDLFEEYGGYSDAETYAMHLDSRRIGIRKVLEIGQLKAKSRQFGKLIFAELQL